MKFTKNDCGCYVNGAFGIDHVYDVVADLVRPFDAKLADELDALASGEADDEFGHEALDDATDKLNEHTEEGISFVWDSGDLLLCENEEE